MSRPLLEVADLIHSAGTAFIERNRNWIRWTHSEVLLAITRCRTAALVVSRLLCKRPSFVFGDGVPGKGAVPLPRPISVEVGCAFIAEFSPGPASVPAKES